eukprot:UN28080
MDMAQYSVFLISEPYIRIICFVSTSRIVLPKRLSALIEILHFILLQILTHKVNLKVTYINSKQDCLVCLISMKHLLRESFDMLERNQKPFNHIKMISCF